MFKAQTERTDGKRGPVDMMILLGVAVNAAVIGAIVVLWVLWALARP